jgi:hypothetical protein
MNIAFEGRKFFAIAIGRLEKFLSPRARESDSVTARG